MEKSGYMTMRLSRIPLFLYLIFKQKLAEAFPCRARITQRGTF